MTFIVAPTPETTSPEPFKPWNLGKLIGQKPPLKLREVWAIRIRLAVTLDPSKNAGATAVVPMSEHGWYPECAPRSRGVGPLQRRAGATLIARCSKRHTEQGRIENGQPHYDDRREHHRKRDAGRLEHVGARFAGGPEPEHASEGHTHSHRGVYAISAVDEYDRERMESCTHGERPA